MLKPYVQTFSNAHKCCWLVFVWIPLLCCWFIPIFACVFFQLQCFDLSHSVISPNCSDWSIKFICKHVAKWRLNKCCCHIGIAFISLLSMFIHPYLHMYLCLFAYLKCQQHSGNCCAQFVIILLLLWLLLLQSKLQLVQVLIRLCTNICCMRITLLGL